MDLDDNGVDAVTVWVARVNRRDGETIVTAWSYRDKAEKWCEHELSADGVTWDDSGGVGPGDRVAGYVAGDMRATIQQVEVMDPISLSKQYPADMPAARHVIDDC